MKVSSILNFGPWPKLHPPLPRTPRQSQQFLNALTSSFRRQLDREYPAAAAPSSDHSPSANDNASVGDRSTEDHPHSSAHATDRHLRTILENPLFRVMPTRPAISSGSPRDYRYMQMEPMAAFDELVALGSVTGHALTQCLRSQLLVISHHTGEDLLKALRDARAGSKVVAWWFASDSKARKFIFHPAAAHTLLKFMVAERLHDTIFAWLSMLARCNLGGQDGLISKTTASKYFRCLLTAFIEAERNYGGGLGSSVLRFVEACKIFKSAGHDERQLLRDTFLPPGARLCAWIMQGTDAHAKNVSSRLYEEYMAIIVPLTQNSLLGVSLPLYHPTHPDPDPFLQYVRRFSRSPPRSWDNTRETKMMQGCFTALRILTDSEKSGDCSDFLVDFMKRRLHEGPLAETSTKNGRKASSEEKDMLTSLDLAFA